MRPQHISYSQVNDWERCPRSWHLSKERDAEQRQTWFLPIGTAVHRMVEDHLAIDKTLQPAEDYFFPLISAQMEIEPDLSTWLHGGSDTDPVVGDKALQKAKDCFDRVLDYLDDIDVWHVEFDASGRLPGLEPEVKAFVDIIGEHKKHGPVIADIKTGAGKPKNNLQLYTYKALLDEGHFWELGRVPKGLWLMADPNASKARPIDLSDVDPAEIGAGTRRRGRA